jgi:glycosyltransferase involved in cell wall biosynthesis
MSPERGRIALVQIEPFPLTNLSVTEQLRKHFPEYEVDVLDIRDLLRARPLLFLRNAFETLVTYGPEIARGRRQLPGSFFHTEFVFEQVRRLVQEQYVSRPYRFSFQFQSIFDASTPGLPHFVYTDHTNLANLMYQGPNDHVLYPESWRRLEATIYRNATMLFVWSSHVQRSLIEHYGIRPERIRCVYAGSNAGAPRGARDVEGRYEAKRILFVGLDWQRKGGPMLLEAFRQVRAVHPEARLTIVGTGPTRPEPNVEVLGEVPLDQVSAHYDRASVFCMPTQREPFGIVFVEAMTHGLPVVATNVGALPDLVENGVNGYLVDPWDTAALAQRLITLLGEPETCRAMGARGRALARERYNWDAVGRRLGIHIREALATADHGPVPSPGDP